MLVTITSIRLKNPFYFFILSYWALKIHFQLKKNGFIAFRKKGLGNLHYTITAWKDEEQMRNFFQDGAHRNAMKKTSLIAKEVCTFTYETDQMPDWEEAIASLKNGKKMAL
jgi:hypothetical protein